MKNFFLYIITGLFGLFFVYFVVRWGVKGEFYELNFSSELSSFTTSVLQPCTSWLMRFRAIYNDGFSIISVGNALIWFGNTLVLPFQLIGGLFMFIFG